MVLITRNYGYEPIRNKFTKQDLERQATNEAVTISIVNERAQSYRDRLQKKIDGGGRLTDSEAAIMGDQGGLAEILKGRSQYGNTKLEAFRLFFPLVVGFLVFFFFLGFGIPALTAIFGALNPLTLVLLLVIGISLWRTLT